MLAVFRKDLRIFMRARSHVEHAILLRHLPVDRDVLLLAQHVERDGLARIVGPKDPHRLHR